MAATSMWRIISNGEIYRKMAIKRKTNGISLAVMAKRQLMAKNIESVSSA